MDLRLTQSTPKPLSAPRTVGIWRLISQLHQGPWTELFAAQPADAVGSPRCDYVVKIARKALQEQPEGALQIRAEAAATSQASHPNLIPVLDASLNAYQPYFVMPRIEGDTLENRMRGNQIQPVPVALWWCRQTAQALAALHAVGWIHRDIKPSNLMISDRGHVTLIDLGFAVQHRTLHDPVFRGTPEFTAPEVLAGRGTLSASADIYALGKVMQKLLPTGSNPPEPVLTLLERLTSTHAHQRPSADELVDLLLKLEIETLGRHILPPAHAA